MTRKTVRMSLTVRPADPAPPWAPGAVGRVQLTPGWATFGYAFPRGAVRSAGVRVGFMPTQTDVKNRWDDGSLKFAVVTCNPVLAGYYDLMEYDPPAGPVIEPPPRSTVQVVFNVGAQAFGADSPAPAPDQLAGPLASEGRGEVEAR
jgi:hypothetical protein